MLPSETVFFYTKIFFSVFMAVILTVLEMGAIVTIAPMSKYGSITTSFEHQQSFAPNIAIICSNVLYSVCKDALSVIWEGGCDRNDRAPTDFCCICVGRL